MVHIGIDGNEANVGERVGSNNYAFNLIQALAKSDRPDIRYTVYLKDQPLSDFPPETKRFRYRVIRPRQLWTQWRLPLDLYLNPNRPQIFYSPGHYAPRYSPIKTAVTVLDLAFLHYPSLFTKTKRGVAQLKSWTEYSVKQATHVFTISAHTQADVINTYHKSPSTISLAYPGIDFTLFKPPQSQDLHLTLKKYSLVRPYFLHVGTLQPRKNLDRLLAAFEGLPPKAKGYDLVFVGGEGWLMDNFLAKLKSSKKAKFIHLLGFIPMADLPALYAGSTCTISVGFEEGFGLPPAEAIACRATVVVSKTGALTEVVGEAGILVDPYSITSIKHGIMASVVQTDAQLKARQAVGLAFVDRFSWFKTAGKVEKVLYELTL